MNMLTIDEIKQRLTPIFETSGVTKATVFGSYAKDTATKKSDIDIVLETENWVRGLHFVGILGDIIDSLNTDVDLIAQRSIKPNSFIAKEIERSGRVIYDRTG
jgi:hypothetical protein